MSVDPVTIGLMLGGSLLGGKKPKQQNVTQTNEPWLAQQPYLRDLFSRSQAWMNQSGFNPLQRQGQMMALNYAMPGFNYGQFGGMSNYDPMSGSVANTQSPSFGGGMFGNLMRQAQGLLGRQWGGQSGGQAGGQGNGGLMPNGQGNGGLMMPGGMPGDMSGGMQGGGGMGGGLPGLIDSAQGGWQFGMNPMANPWMGAASGTGVYDSLSNMMSATPDMNVWGPVMDRAMRGPIQAFGEQVLPNIRSGAVGSGQYGGSRQGIAEGVAMRGLGDTLGDIQTNLANQAANQALQQRTAGSGMASNLLSNAYGTTAGLMSNALGMSPMMANLGLMPSNIFQNIGQQQQMNPLQNLQAYQGLIGGNYGSSQTSPMYSNPMLGAMGGGLMGYQLGGMLGGGGGGANNLGDMGMGLLGGGMMGGGIF